MMQEEELENVPNGLLYALGIGPNNHAVSDRGSTGRNQFWRLLDFDETHTATAFDSDIRVIAVAWNVDPDLICNLDDGRALLDLVHLTVQCDLRHNPLE
jgi:hypothetical protein